MTKRLYLKWIKFRYEICGMIILETIEKGTSDSSLTGTPACSGVVTFFLFLLILLFWAFKQFCLLQHKCIFCGPCWNVNGSNRYNYCSLHFEIQAHGHARVVTRLEDACTIKPGEILITTSTDIGKQIQHLSKITFL